MPRFSRLALVALSLLLAPAAFAQTAPTPAPTTPEPVRDPQAVAILSQSLNSAGGLPTVAALQDYTGSGTITYFWAGQQVQAPATVRGMGVGNFRLDANLPEGVRTWAASGPMGVLITPDGTRQPSAFYNLLAAGSLTLPYVRVASALTDSTTSITYVGLVSSSGQQLHQIHFAPALDPSIASALPITDLGAFDLFIDPASLLITKLGDTVRSESDFRTALPHEISFSNYQTTSGIRLPLTISERVNGQTTWTIKLNAITFNGGLTSTDFNP